MQTHMQDMLINPNSAATILGINPRTLSVWRCTKRYPLRYVKVGGRVMYRKEDIDAFIKNRIMGDTTCEQ